MDNESFYSVIAWFAFGHGMILLIILFLSLVLDNLVKNIK